MKHLSPLFLLLLFALTVGAQDAGRAAGVDDASARQMNIRTLPTNALHRFVTDKCGCVAFLGGSITEMTGWKDRMKEDLQQRFPDTHFTFIDAGIASTGSTPHAFRMERDVFGQGIPDLLFVEAAVNDDTNYFTAIEQVRGMEGIVRHALSVNPLMDIVFLHFIYDPFIAILDAGRQPEVIVNHERVAAHYGLSSLNLADEVARRMRAGEFTWQQFGGTHPAPMGHRVYAATINSLLDIACEALPSAGEPVPHVLPEPLDAFSYAEGHLVNISEATRLKGFQVDADWAPDDGAGVRSGFVHVPMLAASTAGSSFRLRFRGTAVGIFCVAGPQAGVLEYRVDHGPWKRLDTHTEWSGGLYIPWVYMFETELADTRHTLRLRIAAGDRTACQIRDFVVNGR